MKTLLKTRVGRVALHAVVCAWLVAHGVNHFWFHAQGIIREIKGI